jgi:hypothetical protein
VYISQFIFLSHNLGPERLEVIGELKHAVRMIKSAMRWYVRLDKDAYRILLEYTRENTA